MQRTGINFQSILRRSRRSSSSVHVPSPLHAVMTLKASSLWMVSIVSGLGQLPRADILDSVGGTAACRSLLDI